MKLEDPQDRYRLKHAQRGIRAILRGTERMSISYNPYRKSYCIDFIDMEAFEGLLGYEYLPTKVRFYDNGQRITRSEGKSRRLNPSELEKPDDYMKTMARVITTHGKNWHRKKNFEGTGYWEGPEEREPRW